jgi:hypothetical protein
LHKKKLWECGTLFDDDSCEPIIQPAAAENYEINHELIHIIKAFAGDLENDPHDHIDNFNALCSTVRLAIAR